MFSLIVEEIRRYKERNLPEHEFLVVRVKVGEGSYKFIQIERGYMKPKQLIRQRADRSVTSLRHYSELATATSASSSICLVNPPAADNACSVEGWPSEKSRSGAVLIQTVKFTQSQPTLFDVIIVAHCAHKHSESYRVFQRQCYWYSVIIASVLQQQNPGATSEQIITDDEVAQEFYTTSESAPDDADGDPRIPRPQTPSFVQRLTGSHRSLPDTRSWRSSNDSTDTSYLSSELAGTWKGFRIQDRLPGQTQAILKSFLQERKKHLDKIKKAGEQWDCYQNGIREARNTAVRIEALQRAEEAALEMANKEREGKEAALEMVDKERERREAALEMVDKERERREAALEMVYKERERREAALEMVDKERERREAAERELAELKKLHTQEKLGV
ncbi:hypothetical protein D9615_009614 [Tricholomella constricta]|uniref:Uncharacterized protein n=1 Tax=Tricholomella constricta TaxID=117010 RepID=A0A8H5GV59_9AGAR|nr:hypothetical protein D9615_009614 [Tricholomella constricta]